MIRMDAAANSVVVLCSECPSWRVVRCDRIAAGAAGAEHDRTIHGSDRAAKALAEAKRRRRGLA